MIENLKGVYETVNHKQDSHLRLYFNNENEEYPEHWHIDVEILCPLESGYTAICNGTEYRLRKGDILIICPGTLHHLLAEPTGERIIYQVDCSLLTPISGINPILSAMSPEELITPENQPAIYDRVHRLLLEISDFYRDTPAFYEPSVYARTLEIFSIIGREGSTKRESGPRSVSMSSGRNTEAMSTVCNYIAAHCSENLTLDAMAGMAGFSKYHFERLFKQYTNMSFYQYLTWQRISVAERLLLDSDTSITDIAYQSGFSSGTSFARTFRQIMHYTPSEFRAKQDRPGMTMAKGDSN